MPGLSGYLHYRMLDVTALKVLAEVSYAHRPAFQKPKDNAHDALVDIKNAIAELQHYKQHLLASGAG
jgi:oligoribonuclease